MGVANFRSWPNPADRNQDSIFFSSKNHTLSRRAEVDSNRIRYQVPSIFARITLADATDVVDGVELPSYWPERKYADQRGVQPEREHRPGHCAAQDGNKGTAHGACGVGGSGKAIAPAFRDER
ncbi:MAG: hypothetical protein JWR52_3900 [Marmoricola sp.]|nr:hypothetical protein [Marmoricola sp.]